MVLLSFPNQKIQPLHTYNHVMCFYIYHFLPVLYTESETTGGKKTHLPLLPCFGCMCMLSHECECVPASLLDCACLDTLSSSQGPFPFFRGLPAQS